MRVSVWQASILSACGHLVALLFFLTIGQLQQAFEKVPLQTANVRLISESSFSAFHSDPPLLNQVKHGVSIEGAYFQNNSQLLLGSPQNDSITSIVNTIKMNLIQYEPEEMTALSNLEHNHIELLGSIEIMTDPKSIILGVLEHTTYSKSELFSSPHQMPVLETAVLKENFEDVEILKADFLKTVPKLENNFAQTTQRKELNFKDASKFEEEKIIEIKKRRLYELQGWAKLVQISIRNSLRYPLKARVSKLEGVVLVRVQISRLGIIQKAHLLASSGHTTLDQAAISAVQSAKSIPVAPLVLKDPFYTFRLPVRFEI